MSFELVKSQLGTMLDDENPNQVQLLHDSPARVLRQFLFGFLYGRYEQDKFVPKRRNSRWHYPKQRAQIRDLRYIRFEGRRYGPRARKAGQAARPPRRRFPRPWITYRDAVNG